MLELSSGVSSTTYQLVKLQFSARWVIKTSIIKEYLEIEKYNKVSAADSEEKISKILENLAELQKVCILKFLEVLLQLCEPPRIWRGSVSP